MARITAGNRLYLYLLLKREVGVGRQVSLARVGEVLEADGIAPADLGCSTVDQLVGELGEFVKLTTFKKGRVFATPLANAEYDELLERAQRGDKNAGKKSFKRKGGKATLPVKPRHVVVESLEPGAGGSSESSERVLAAQSAASENAPLNSEEPALVGAEDNQSAASDGLPSGGRDGAGTLTDRPPVGAGTVDEPDGQGSASGGLSSGNRDDAGTLSGRPPLRVETPDEPVSQISVDAVVGDEIPPEPANDVEAHDVPEDADDGKSIGESSDESPSPMQTTASFLEMKPSISFTITYDPYEGLEESAGVTEDENPVVDEGVAQPEPAPQPAPSVTQLPAAPHRVMPRSIANDVLIRDEQLTVLYQLLPLGADVMASLEEDWRIAKAADTVEFEGGKVTFPLRYARADGSPVTVTIRRAPRSASGKRWQVVDVDAGTEPGEAPSDTGVEGLATRTQGAWAALAGNAAADADDPVRTFMRLATSVAGDAAFDQLVSLAAPEDWNREELVEYLAVTYLHVRQEGKVVRGDGGVRAFDTGLTTPDGTPILGTLTPREGADTPYELDFTTEADSLDRVPQPASYVHSLDDVLPDASLPVHADEEQFAAAARRSLVATRSSWRMATPAFDIVSGQIRLLVPVTLDGEAKAAALARENGTYRMTAVLSLKDAHTCARIVSGDLPRWLG